MQGPPPPPAAAAAGPPESDAQESALNNLLAAAAAAAAAGVKYRRNAAAFAEPLNILLSGLCMPPEGSHDEQLGYYRTGGFTVAATDTKQEASLPAQQQLLGLLSSAVKFAAAAAAAGEQPVYAPVAGILEGLTAHVSDILSAAQHTAYDVFKGYQLYPHKASAVKCVEPPAAAWRLLLAKLLRQRALHVQQITACIGTCSTSSSSSGGGGDGESLQVLQLLGREAAAALSATRQLFEALVMVVHELSPRWDRWDEFGQQGSHGRPDPSSSTAEQKLSKDLEDVQSAEQVGASTAVAGDDNEAVEVQKRPAPSSSSTEGQQLEAVTAAYNALQDPLQTCIAVESVCTVAAGKAAALTAEGTFEGTTSGAEAAADANDSSSSGSRSSFSLHSICNAAMSVAVNLAGGSKSGTSSSSSSSSGGVPNTNRNLTTNEAMSAVNLANHKQQIVEALSAYEDLQQLPGQLLAVAEELVSCSAACALLLQQPRLRQPGRAQ
jgi:hypothetical protein